MLTTKENYSSTTFYHFPRFYLLQPIGRQVELKVPTTGGVQPASVTRVHILATLKKRVKLHLETSGALLHFLHRILHFLSYCIQLFKEQEGFHPYQLMAVK